MSIEQGLMYNNILEEDKTRRWSKGGRAEYCAPLFCYEGYCHIL